MRWVNWTEEQERMCAAINESCEAIFFYLKYGVIFLLFFVALLTIFRYRGFYREQKLKEGKFEKDEKDLREKLEEPHVILGVFYLALATGLLIGYLPKLLIVLFDPLPDQLIFLFMDFLYLLPQESIESIRNPSTTNYPHEKSIFYLIAFCSFAGFVEIVLGLRFMILYANKTHTTSFKLFVSGVFICAFTGFTTFMPLFL